MKFEFPQITRFSIILFFVNFLNAERPRFKKVQAGIDRPCPQNSEYRPSQDETIYRQELFGFLNLLHPTLSPADINEVEDMSKRDDKCTFKNLSTVENHTMARLLPVIKRRKGHQSTSFGMPNSDYFHDSNESESDVVEYFVYGTLLVSCLTILLLW